MSLRRFLLSLAYLAALPAQAVELVKWERIPLPVALHVNQERIVFMNRNVRVGFPPELKGKLRVQSTGGAVYLQPGEQFARTRLVLQDVENGEMILLDISAEEGKSVLEPVSLVYQGEVSSSTGNSDVATIDSKTPTAGERQSTSKPKEKKSTTPLPVALTRYAAQSLYAPSRTIEPLPGVRSISLALPDKLTSLLPSESVEIKPLAAWGLQGYSVVALTLRNQRAEKVVLDPRRLQGNFYSATFQHRWLGASGTPEDTTTVYLVTKGRPDAAFLPEPVKAKTGKGGRAMQIKSNTLLKVIVPVVLLSAVMIGVKSCGGAKQTQDSADNTTVADLTQEELRILGIEGDTPQDTLRTLVGRIKTIQTSQENLEKQNAALAEENARLQNKGSNVDGRINDAVNAVKQESTQAQQKLQAEQQRLAGLLESLKNTVPGPGAGSNTPAGSDLPVGLGLEDAGLGETVAQGTVWIEPQDGVQLDRNGKPVTGAAAATNGTGTFQFPTAFGGLNDNEITRQKAELDRTAKNQQSIEETDLPVYTLPENSTLVGSQAMTALLGRVPIDGKVTDPYPFKVLIGKENLTANGIELPDVEGAIVSGTATGDWVLSCVRGEVHSITFVFTDGTVRTVPQSAKSSDGSNGKSNGGSIGWLSDEHGIPCLSGDRKSNASTYLPTLFALSAAGAASDAMSESQTTTTTDGTSITSTLTGSAGQAALGKALSGGTNELADWVKARYGQMFDAIYVPPGANVAVHITRQIPIDYEEKGRKVKYDFDVSQQHELD